MANGNLNFFGNTPDYGLSEDIIRILGLSPEGHIGGQIVTHPGSMWTHEGETISQAKDHGIFNPFSETSIITALAKKYGLSAEEQANLFKPGMFQPLSGSMVNMLDPSIHRTELSATQTAAPSGLFSQASSMSPTMAGSGLAI